MYVLQKILAHIRYYVFASGCQLKGQQKLSTPSTIYRWEWTNKVFFGWRTRRSSCFYILGGDIWPCKIQGQVAQQLYLLCHTVSLLFTYITLYYIQLWGHLQTLRMNVLQLYQGPSISDVIIFLGGRGQQFAKFANGQQKNTADSRGVGVKNREKFANVLNGWSLRQFPSRIGTPSEQKRVNSKGQLISKANSNVFI